MITIFLGGSWAFWGGSFYPSNTLDRTLTAYLLPHHGKLSYGRRPRQLWQRRYAAGDKGSRVNRHLGRRVGRQKLPSPKRGQNDNDRGKTREFKQRDSKASCLPWRHRAHRNLKDMAKIPRCANYVSSENKSINDTLLIKTKTGGVWGRLQVVIVSISKFV